MVICHIKHPFIVNSLLRYLQDGTQTAYLSSSICLVLDSFFFAIFKMQNAKMQCTDIKFVTKIIFAFFAKRAKNGVF